MSEANSPLSPVVDEQALKLDGLPKADPNFAPLLSISSWLSQAFLGGWPKEGVGSSEERFERGQQRYPELLISPQLLDQLERVLCVPMVKLRKVKQARRLLQFLWW
jgi:hypothetical protein